MPFKKGSGKLLPVLWPLDGRDLNTCLFSWLRHFLSEALSMSSQNCSIMEAFFNYVSPTEKDALTEILTDFKGADMEELLNRAG